MSVNLAVSPQRASALENAVVAVCSEAVLQLRTARCDTSQLAAQIRSHLFDIVGLAYDVFLERLLSRPAISVLPAELLCHIFSLLNLSDRISTSHVCKAWRDISLAAPSLLWSNIVAHSFPSGSLYDRLDRARAVPVELDVTVGPDTADELIGCLLVHLSHIRLLSLGIGDDTVSGQLPQAQDLALSEALARPAPMLTRFLLFNPYSGFSFSFGPPGIFGGQAPLLELVKYQGDELERLSLCAAAFAGVRQILLSTSRWALPSDISLVLPALPNLEELGIDVDEYEPFEEDQVVAFPPGLSRFVLISNATSEDFDPAQVVRYVCRHAPRVADVWVSFESTTIGTANYARQLAADVQRLGGPITFLGVLPSGPPDDPRATVDVRFKTARGHQRTILQVPLPLVGWTPDFFDNLTRLSLSETCWTRLPPYAHMLRLLELEVRLDLQPVHPVLSSVFLLPATVSGPHEQHTLICPLLRILEITCAPCRQGQGVVYVPPEVISDLILFRVDFAEDRLERLLLRGPRLLQSNILEVARLLTLVDDVVAGDGVAAFVDPDHTDDLLYWD